MTATYYMVKDWETYPNSNRYNFFLQVYDENYKEVEHPANDRCYWPTAWRKIAAQRGRAIKKAMKAGLTEIFQMPPKAAREAEPNKKLRDEAQ